MQGRIGGYRFTQRSGIRRGMGKVHLCSCQERTSFSPVLQVLNDGNFLKKLS